MSGVLWLETGLGAEGSLSVCSPFLLPWLPPCDHPASSPGVQPSAQLLAHPTGAGERPSAAGVPCVPQISRTDGRGQEASGLQRPWEPTRLRLCQLRQLLIYLKNEGAQLGGSFTW